jgi:hypothetical protein
MSARARIGRVRLYPYVEAPIAKRLEALCAATGITESAVVEKALGQYLDQISDTTLLMRRLDRLGRAQARSHRDVELLSEAFATWIKLWLAHTPQIPDEAKASARVSAQARYRQFVTHVAEQMADGSRFLDDLPRENVADESELEAAALTAADATGDSAGS